MESEGVHNEDDVLNEIVVASATAIVTYYYTNYLEKQPCRTSSQTGHRWCMEVLCGHPRRCQEQFRMEKYVFGALCNDLKNKYGLEGAKKMSTEEQVAIFLMVLGHGLSNRMLQERFQHSGETISRQFHNVLKAILRFSIDIIKTPENIDVVSQHIRNNPKYWPHFKDCIGAIDGTHVKAVLPPNEQAPYFGRKAYPTQNVMAVCDFNLCFTFTWPGWGGSAHDTRIFYEAIRSPDLNFPHPKEGKYYLVDAGYPNIKGYLAPYKGERYHLPDFRRGGQPTNTQETFNQVHSSLRSVIERTFGVWKSRWRILDSMHSFNFDTQVAIVVASMAIHNYIRREARVDIIFDEYDSDKADKEYKIHQRIADDEKEMNEFRDRLSLKIAAAAGK